ncbi:hypothetical protein ABBQ38_002374 [Trebouxia sp. C0009 RCD-2024]
MLCGLSVAVLETTAASSDEALDPRQSVNNFKGLPSGFWTIPDNWAPPLVLSTGCPGMAPSFNCPWEICEDGSAVVWNKVEKPKAYDAWLEVLATLMKYWGHELQGVMSAVLLNAHKLVSVLNQVFASCKTKVAKIFDQPNRRRAILKRRQMMLPVLSRKQVCLC